MNRTIKFRAWLPSLNKFDDTNGAFIDCYGKLYCVTTSGRIVRSKEFDEYTIQWYTGLNDKNGKEIYEGDIVKWGDLNYIVEYNHTACKWQGRSPEHHGYLHLVTEHFRDLMNGIIISNIFEHKHLLEK